MHPAPLRPQLFRRQALAVRLRRSHVRLCSEVLEELPLEYLPVPVEPRVTELRRQRLKLLYVLRVCLHQRRVVRYQRLYEAVLLRLLALLEAPVYEQSLDPCVSLSSGVAGVVDTLRKIVHPSHTGAQLLHLLLALLRRLVHEQHVHLRPLKAQRILVVVAVAEQYPAAVGEDDVLFPVVVACYPLALVRVATEHFAQRYDVVFLQFRVSLSYYHYLYPRVPQAQQHRLDPHRPALSAASRPAVAYVFMPICHKQTLLLARLRYPQLRHSPSSLLTCSVPPLSRRTSPSKARSLSPSQPRPVSPAAP